MTLHDLCNLRFVARRLNAIAAPYVFAHTIVNISLDNPAYVQDKIAYLSTCASAYSRSLEIRSPEEADNLRTGDYMNVPENRNEDARAPLADALASLRRVTRIS